MDSYGSSYGNGSNNHMSMDYSGGGSSQYNAYNSNPPTTTFSQSFNVNRKNAEQEAAKKIEAAFQNVNSLEDLINMKEAYKQKLTALQSLHDKLVMRVNEILRNRKRDRDGFKDPAIVENRKLQDDVKGKIDDVNRILIEIDKKLRVLNKAMLDVEENCEDGVKPSNYEAQIMHNAYRFANTNVSQEENADNVDEQEFEEYLRYEYYDPGNHWCRDCDKLIPKIKDYFEHLHSKEHWKFVENELHQPWIKPKKVDDLNKKSEISKIEKTKAPVKGAQFLVPTHGFYCPLCSQFMGDNSSAEEHLKSAKHNRYYTRFINFNIDYEHKWNSDKGKALSRHQSNERKRQKDEQKEKEEKEREAKKQKLEEERKKEKEKEKERERHRDRDRDRDREKENKSYKSEFGGEKSSERFRLKEVKLDLNQNNRQTFSKDKHTSREKDRHRDKHKRPISISSSSSESESSSESVERKKVVFDENYIKNDPKLKLKAHVVLNVLNTKVARMYRCEQLYKLLKEPPKLKSDFGPQIENKINENKMDTDFGAQNDDEFDQIKLNINEIVEGFDKNDQNLVADNDLIVKNETNENKDSECSEPKVDVSNASETQNVRSPQECEPSVNCEPIDNIIEEDSLNQSNQESLNKPED